MPGSDHSTSGTSPSLDQEMDDTQHVPAGNEAGLQRILSVAASVLGMSDNEYNHGDESLNFKNGHASPENAARWIEVVQALDRAKKNSERQNVLIDQVADLNGKLHENGNSKLFHIHLFVFSNSRSYTDGFKTAPTLLDNDYLQNLYDQVDNLCADENENFEEAAAKSKLLLASCQASEGEAVDMKRKEAEAEDGQSH